MRLESERSQVSRKAGEGTGRVRSLRSFREVAYSEGAAADGVLADIRKEYRLPESTTDGMASSSPDVLEQAEILYLGHNFQVGKRYLLVRFPHPLKASFELGQVQRFYGPLMRQGGPEIPPRFLKCCRLKGHSCLPA
jgi:hypothetical protein